MHYYTTFMYTHTHTLSPGDTTTHPIDEANAGLSVLKVSNTGWTATKHLVCLSGGIYFLASSFSSLFLPRKKSPLDSRVVEYLPRN